MALDMLRGQDRVPDDWPNAVQIELLVALKRVRRYCDCTPPRLTAEVGAAPHGGWLRAKRVCALAALCWLVGAAPTFFALRGVAQPEPRDEAVGACTRLLRGIGRLQHHPHARGYLLSQTFYLAAASNDGATAALFAVEVLDMEVGAITLVTLYAAVVSIGGAQHDAAPGRGQIEFALVVGCLGHQGQAGGLGGLGEAEACAHVGAK